MDRRDAVVVDALRTPFGRHGGRLGAIRPDDLAAHVIQAVVARTGIEPGTVDDVFWGAANQAGEDNRNVARMAALLAGLGVETPGVTVNRLCASGLQAVVSAAREIQAGAADTIIAGGSESMTRAPYVLLKPAAAFQRGHGTIFDTTLGWRMVNPRMEELYPTVSLGQTAENVAHRCGISRLDQDCWALRSHQRAIDADRRGDVACEVVPLEAPVGRGEPAIVARDEGPRPDTSLEQLARLAPAFVAGGTVTAGNSSPISDGAACVLVMSVEQARRTGLRPLARFVDAAAAGVDPAMMGMGPVPATRKLLDRVDVAVGDIGVVEINEAFAAQVLACVRELGIPEDRVNRAGGAIALGHPLGASGARLVGRAVWELRAGGERFALTTMCVGVGQGLSALFECLPA